MATYLELCNKAAKESGLFSGTTPISAVTGQTGNAADMVRWVSDSWKNVQLLHRGWKFRRIDISDKSLIVDTAYYAKTAFALTDVAEFIGGTAPNDRDAFTLYDSSIGVSDEAPVYWIEWGTFKRRYRRGSQTSNRPVHYSIAPDGKLWFGPAPDKAYTMNGEYIRDAQILTDNADIPICPEDHHDIIVWGAVKKAHENDEDSVAAMAIARNEYEARYTALLLDQLPRISTKSEPIA